MTRPAFPDGIPGHPYEEKRQPGTWGTGCSYCGKPKDHPTHKGPFKVKEELTMWREIP